MKARIERLGRADATGRAVGLSAAATAALLGAGWLVRPPFVFLDLDVYRIGVRAWLDGQDLYGPLPATYIGQLLPFAYPPFAALALSPLALLPWTVSWVALGLLSLLSLAAVIYVTARRSWPPEERGAPVVLAAVALPLSLLLEPVWETFQFGQLNLLLMALVVLDCLAERPRWPRGALVGIAAAIKLTPAAFALFFLLRRDYRAGLAAAATFLAAGLLGFAVAPGSSWEYWTGSARGLVGEVGSATAMNQAILGALARLPQLSGETRLALWLALDVAVLALAALGMRRALRADDRALALAINAGLALLVSPLSWGHHWVYAVPALLVMAARAIRTGDRRWGAAAVLTALTFAVAPFQVLPREGGRELGWSWWEHLVGNPYGLLAVILLAAIAWPEIAGFRRRATADEAEGRVRDAGAVA